MNIVQIESSQICLWSFVVQNVSTPTLLMPSQSCLHLPVSSRKKEDRLQSLSYWGPEVVPTLSFAYLNTELFVVQRRRAESDCCKETPLFQLLELIKIRQLSSVTMRFSASWFSLSRSLQSGDRNNFINYRDFSTDRKYALIAWLDVRTLLY